MRPYHPVRFSSTWPLGLVALLPLAARAAPPLSAPSAPSALSPTTVPAKPRMPVPRAATSLPSPEPDVASAGAAGASPFGARAVSPSAGQTLTAPVTLTANTSADALTVTQSGGGRAIDGAVTNASSALSAVKGITNGSGSGVNGVTTGTKGQAGKFENTSTSSTQSTVLVTTAGLGVGLESKITNTGEIDSPAILGNHSVTDGSGVGVEGDGGWAGVKGVSPSSVGVLGFSTSGYAVYGGSDSSLGVYGTSTSSTGVYGRSESGSGVIGSSGSGYAGTFYGPVYASGAVTAASYGYTSDRDQKQDFAPVDAPDVLNRIAAMPITAWGYRARPAERHIGPMAQDFRAAFGLGADEKHIDVVDGIGVSLAAIQALQRRLQDKEARVETLEARLQALQSAVDARFAAIDRRDAAPALASAQP